MCKIISKKKLKHNVKFWEGKCDEYAKSYYKVLKENDMLKELIVKQKKETQKYKTLYLQMIEMNLNLAEKVGVTSE